MKTSDLADMAKDSAGFIFCKYIVRNGKAIYPKNAKCFKIPLRKFKKR